MLTMFITIWNFFIKINRHLLAFHGNIENLKCLICNAVFSSLGTLKIHIKGVHENIRDHKCMICNKAFLTIEHECWICHKTFKQRAYRQVHEKKYSWIAAMKKLGAVAEWTKAQALDQIFLRCLMLDSV
jgi:hypothetical protein